VTHYTLPLATTLRDGNLEMTMCRTHIDQLVNVGRILFRRYLYLLLSCSHIQHAYKSIRWYTHKQSCIYLYVHVY